MINFRKLVKSKTFWGFLAILIPAEILITLDILRGEHIEIFQGIIGIIMMGMLPAIFATGLSVRTGLSLKWIHHNLINFTNRKNIKYYIEKKFSEKESYKKFVIYNVWYTVGITFLLLKFSGINFENTASMMTLTILYVFLGLMFASSVNFAIFLINKKSIFYENHSDGSKINLGSDLRKIINFGLAPFQIIFFIYPLVENFNIIIPFSISLGMALGICFIASLTSYFLLKRHYVEKLYKKFESKLKL